jgi:hypothetical protein
MFTIYAWIEYLLSHKNAKIKSLDLNFDKTFRVRAQNIYSNNTRVSYLLLEIIAVIDYLRLKWFKNCNLLLVSVR